MKLIFSLLLVFLIPNFAFAAFDINCTNEDCWTQGWTTTNLQTRESSEITCVANNCMENGWVQRVNRQFYSEVACLDGGCWVNGLEIFDRNGQMTGGFLCKEDPNLGLNCMTAGWTVIDWRRRPVGEAHCVAGDCEKYGWDIELHNGHIQIARCKDESCFTYGWTLRP